MSIGKPAGKSLPPHPDLSYLKKLAKEHLVRLRKRRPEARLAEAQLAEAQLAVAREYGFASWRKLKSHVDEVRGRMDTGAASEAQVKDFAQALQRKDHASVQSMLHRTPALANASEPEGRTMLHIAAEWNDAQTVENLLGAGAKSEVFWKGGGHTPLSWAVTSGAFAAASALVRCGANVDLFCAAGTGDMKTTTSFFSANGMLQPRASRTGSSRYGSDGKRLPCPPEKDAEVVADALYIACRHGQRDVAKFLLEHGPDLSFRAYMGGTLLHWAHFGGDAEIIDTLRKAGADESALDNVFKCTPRGFGIHVPCEWGILKNVRRRLKNDGALANIFDGGMTPLHRVARGGRAAIVKWLLKAGADPTVRDANGKTAIDVARERGHEEVVAEFKK